MVGGMDGTRILWYHVVPGAPIMGGGGGGGAPLPPGGGGTAGANGFRFFAAPPGPSPPLVPSVGAGGVGNNAFKALMAASSACRVEQ